MQLPDGRYLVADSGEGIWLLDANGIPLGIAPETAVGQLTQNSGLTVLRGGSTSSGAPPLDGSRP